MLTIEEIRKIRKRGVTLRYSRSKKEKIKGEYIHDNLEVIIYKSNIISSYDNEMTILHEFVHARDYISGYRYGQSRKHYSVEREARRTYSNRSDVLQYIKKIYKIR